MDKILNQLDKLSNWKNFLKSSCKKNQIPISFASEMTILKARAFERKFVQKYQKICNADKQKQQIHFFWCQNELKVFNWLLIVISALREKNIQNFTQQQWYLLTEIFKFKQKLFLEYEAEKLLNIKRKTTRPWRRDQQQQLLQLLKSEEQDIKWNQIGRKLFCISKKQYFRTGKQCKQHWFNHLDPRKIRGAWRIQQDIQLVKLTESLNRKWASIVKYFNGERTQHMIKNRFKSLLMKQKKKIPHIKRQSKLIQSLMNDLQNEQSQYQQNIKVKIQSFDNNQYKKENKQIIQQIQIAEEQIIKEKLNQNQMEKQYKRKSHLYEVNDVKTIQINYAENSFNSFSNIIQQNIDDQNKGYNGFKIYSPYCMNYSLGFNLTPTGLTPATYMSPPAFFSSNFGQTMSIFQHILNNPQFQNSLNKKN